MHLQVAELSVVSKSLQGRASMLHFYTHCKVNVCLLTCGRWQVRIPSFSGPAAVLLSCLESSVELQGQYLVVTQ